MPPSGASVHLQGLCWRQPARRCPLRSWWPLPARPLPGRRWHLVRQDWPAPCRECVRRLALPSRQRRTRLARHAKRRQRRRLAQPQPSGSSAQAWQ